MSNLACTVLLLAGIGAPEPEPDILTALEPVSGGLTFAEVLVRGVEGSPGVHKTRADYAVAENKASTAWLGFAPRLDLSGAYVRISEVDNTLFDTAGRPLFPQILDSYLFRARVTVPVSEYFLERVHAYDATLLVEEVRHAQVDAEQQAAAHRAAEAFLDLIAARAAQIVAQRSIAVLDRQLQNVEAQVDAGLAVPADRSRIAAQLASTKVAHLQAVGATEVRMAILGRILRVGPEHRLEHGEPIFTKRAPVPGTADELLASALVDRPEITGFRKIVAARTHVSQSSISGMLPKLSLDAGLDLANPKPRVFPQSSEFGGAWDLSVRLSWSPNDFTTGYNASFEADRELDKARADLGTMETTVRIEVRSALAARTAAMASIDAAHEALEASKTSLADRQQLYEAGEATTVELLDAESDLRRSQLQLVNAYIQTHRAHVQLDRALGRLVAKGAAE